LYTDSFTIGLINTDNHSINFFTPFKDGLEYPYYTATPLGDGIAGEVIRTGATLRIPDVRKEDKYIGGNPNIRSELCIPLKIGVTTIGVINAESNRLDAFSEDDERFLMTIAGQLSTILEKEQYLIDLRETNIELSQAYDTTLEGWAKALELRDNETEGHSKRVSNLSVQLAVEIGLGEQEIINIYRGALLHDIGKMGIPDQILRKSGKLTDDEWDIMRCHPAIALDLLAPISHLRAALDIPYCHHEHWDGNGYPRGIKGEEIPLIARIFAIVDVWDSLISDRPYSKAWPKEDARRYIQEKSGTQFDPDLVQAFLRVIDNWVF
jgi:response regulator RpfG family c-di-GMP phosphodiesterase